MFKTLTKTAFRHTHHWAFGIRRFGIIKPLMPRYEV